MSVVIGYQVMNKFGGMWFFVPERSIALAYFDMGYKVRKCVVEEFNVEEERDAISKCNRQHNTESVCELPDEGTLPSYREPATTCGGGN